MHRVLPLLLLCACPPPLEQTCQRVLVSASGNANQDFGGGPGTNDPRPPLGIVGTPLTVTFFAPLSACVSDALRADVTSLDPDNLPLAVRLDGDPVRVGFEGAVKLSIAFTPTRPGLHTLHVAFEPSLGARTQLVEVASDGLAGLTTRVPIPPGANCAAGALWAVADDTVACEERASGFVSVTSADGGLTRFPGEQLVVVDTVLWSINAASTTLERRVFEDGGVRVTHTFPNFPSVATPAMHDVGLALRYRANGRLALVQLTRSGSTVREVLPEGQVGAPLAYFVEDGGSVFRSSSVECPFDVCVNLPDVVALDPGLVWRLSQVFDGVSVAHLSGYTRPTTLLDSTPRFTLSHAVDPIAMPAYGFERLPLWLTPPTGGAQRVLVTVENEALLFSAWPRSQVLRVGRHHLVLADPNPGFVRVIRL